MIVIDGASFKSFQYAWPPSLFSCCLGVSGMLAFCVICYPPSPSSCPAPNPPPPLAENPVLPFYRTRIEEMGFKPEKVAELVSRTFNEMIFIHGDVHCDPHAANLFLRKDEATGQLQLVLLDHGLYRQVLVDAALCLQHHNPTSLNTGKSNRCGCIGGPVQCDHFVSHGSH